MEERRLRITLCGLELRKRDGISRRAVKTGSRQVSTVAELFTLKNQPSSSPLFISSKFSVSASLPTFSNGANASSALLRTADLLSFHATICTHIS
jgi:hypothetical protein